MRIFILILTFSFAFHSFAKPVQIAIVIDDIGYRISDKHALTLPEPVTLSFLPHTPFGQSLAEAAHRQNKEVLLHIPMESTIGKKLGPGAITSDMNESKIRATLGASFEEIPFAVGINNHMGSHLTTLYDPMAWTMGYLKDHNLLFLDSVTSAQSKGQSVAREFGVPVMRRHVFLDNQLTVEYITGQFNQLLDKARLNQKAIGIAHPHPETIEILNTLLPTLAKHNIELVKLSSLYHASNIEQRIAKKAD
ncbi:divergent polysaccharide deacetylase family protein [Thalassotalea atypica]|uniref:divergent polysaccharide deacetylase family protein n=1 Tax=Thalassotalea atypica TaxID=2054316 RepID=UPI002572E326|nr:divergent polysaccharide deacetylase family protein [Thalassotalea atypica]